jgi:hypothetical protein
VALTRADQIRQFAYDCYLAPARAQGLWLVTINAGEVRRQMTPVCRVQDVCSALSTRKFEESYRVERLPTTGPTRGASANFTFRL